MDERQSLTHMLEWIKMILGYNRPRPKKENYERFVDELMQRLQKLGDKGLSLMLYGSYVRGDYNPGRSDIDAVLTFPHDVVIDKDFMHEVSIAVHQSSKRKNEISFPLELFQISPLDITTIRDGRFNSYTIDYCDYFNSAGKIVVGPDYRKEMKGLKTKSGETSTISHNLRKIRISLLSAEYNRQEDYEKFLKGFNGALNATSSSSKQVLYLIDGGLRENRFSPLKELSNYLPEVNVEPLERVKKLYHHPTELDSLYKNPDELMKVWNSTASFFEELVRGYIKKYPRKN